MYNYRQNIGPSQSGHSRLSGTTSPAQIRKAQQTNSASETQPLFIQNASSSLTQKNERASYFIDKETANEIAEMRSPISTPNAKKYQGVDRVNKELRHIASAVFTAAKSSGLNMVEVQCSVLDGTLHISSNFHSDKIIQSLQESLNKDYRAEEKSYRPADFNDWEDVYDSREHRHATKLNDFVDSDSRMKSIVRNMRREIRQDVGVPHNTNLNNEEIASQAVNMLKDIRAALVKLKDGDSSSIMIHAPLKSSADEKTRETTHAEQNIQEYIATQGQQALQSVRKNHGIEDTSNVIVPMAGRFVACATCNEVEHVAKSSERGFFNPESNQAVLHRATSRVGRAFPGERQYIAHNTLSSDSHEAISRAKDIAHQFALGKSGNLSSHHKELVTPYSFDTDSDSDPEDKKPRRPANS
ncbi:hypothetical protein [Agarilytica rhodophyticola]|uniref:hypothetical protein n=1 Tax=Agarilytica rhodophyticola TaxID=1737490 RepID=UPI000B343697|nr:hypothetical protein [Agarilytica rhodophyticola]